MSSLREIMQSSSTIATGSIIAHGRRKYLEPVKMSGKKDNNPYKPGDVIVSHKSPEEVEAMLAAEFGVKLQEKRDRKDIKVPTMIELSDMNLSPASIAKRVERRKAAREIEPAKLQPKHLTPERLKELVDQGKTFEDIARMYNAAEKTLNDKLREWGLKGLFKKGRRSDSAWNC